MKVSNTTIRELSALYRSVLKKCFMLNAAVLIGAFMAVPAVAQEYDTTLKDAIAALPKGTSSNFTQATFTVDKDVTNGAGFDVSPNNYLDLTIDFQNHSYQVEQGTAWWLGYRLNSGNNVTLKNGTLTLPKESQFYVLINNFAKQLTIENMVLDGSNLIEWKRTLYSGYGTTNIKNSTIIASADEGIALLVQYYKGGYGNYDHVVTVENSTIEGRIVIETDETGINADRKHDVTITGGTMGAAKTAGNGGKIYASGTTSLNDLTLDSNEAANGGAIYNEITYTAAGEISGRGILNLNNVTLSNNTATGEGGAFYNSGTANLSGNNKFTGNRANGVGNDIYNAGTVNVVSGTTTIDGGITGDGILNVAANATLDIQTAKVEQSSVTFAPDSILAASLLSSSSYGSLKADTITAAGATLSLTVDAAGEYEVVSGEGADAFEVSSSGLYNLEKDTNTTDKKLVVTAKVKSSEEIASQTGISEKSAAVLSGVASGNTETSKQITVALQDLLKNNNVAAVEQATEALAPTNNATVQSVSSSVNEQIITAVGGRIGPSQGRSGGDVTASVGPWVKGLYNKSKQEKTSGVAGFHGYMQGVALGIDTLINDTYTLGIGYAYNTVDVKSLGRKTDVYGHNFFAYAQYQPNAWYINGTVSYGMSDYKEHKNVAGILVNGKYDVDTIGGQVMTGYETSFGLTPHVGARYLHIEQDSYTDTAGQRIETDNSDILTAVAGASYGYDITTENVVFTPELRLAATYDIISDNANATVAIGSASYTSDGRRLPRFGVEAGVGLKWNIAQRMDINLDYDASIRRRYTSHTGTISLKYNF